MRAWMLSVICLGAVIAVESKDVVQYSHLEWKESFTNKEGYFALDDGSYWKVVGFSKRWRNPLEWWRGEVLAPDTYDCAPQDWFVGAPITIYPKQGHLEADEADASNMDILRTCSHLMVHANTGQVLFAIPMHRSQWLTDFAAALSFHHHQVGYEAGKNAGYESGVYLGKTLQAEKEFQRGYDKGFEEGQAKGLQEGREEERYQSRQQRAGF